VPEHSAKVQRGVSDRVPESEKSCSHPAGVTSKASDDRSSIHSSRARAVKHDRNRDLPMLKKTTKIVAEVSPTSSARRIYGKVFCH
jgi:hypothetical protein